MQNMKSVTGSRCCRDPAGETDGRSSAYSMECQDYGQEWGEPTYLNDFWFLNFECYASEHLKKQLRMILAAC